MYDKYFIKLITESNTFDEVCERLNVIDDKKLLGTYFEWFVHLVLLCDPRYSTIVRHCWLLSDLPVITRNYLQIPVNDIGIDLVIETNDNTFYAVQAKYRKDLNCVIDWKELSTFFGLTFGLTNKFKKGILVTNTINPNKYIKGKSNFIANMD